MIKTKDSILPFLIITLVFFIVTIPLILKPEIEVYDSIDEGAFHYPTVRSFNKHFPNLDLIDYRSATTPLYHIVLAVLGLFIGTDLIILRFVNAFIGLACLFVVYVYLQQRKRDPLKGLVFTFIFMLSPYFIGPAIRLSTDNMALLFAISSIFVLEYDLGKSKNPLISNFLILLTILTRQIYAWLIGFSIAIHIQKYVRKRPDKELLIKLAPIAIPIVGLAYFLFLWKGFTPPYLEQTSFVFTWASPIYIVSLVGLYGSALIFWIVRMYKGNPGKVVIIPLIIAICAVVLLLNPISSEYDLDRQGGSLFLVAQYLPTLFSTPLIYWILFPLGSIYLYIIGRQLVSDRNYVMIVAFTLWMLTYTIAFRTWQKYYEPFILFGLGYSIMTNEERNWYYWLGPLGILIGFVGIDLFRFYL